MIPRYTRPEMGRLWDPERRFAVWLDVELLACEAWEKLGKVPKGTAGRIGRRLAKSPPLDPARIEAIEKEVKHDVIAFLTHVAERAGSEARWLHLGMTSSDVLDTGLAVLMGEAAELMLRGVDDVLAVLKRQARRFARTPMIGRTHGIHAEPITFGVKLANWHQEMRRNKDRLRRAAETIRVGKVSGAVGVFANSDPRVEAHVCRKLGLRPAAVSSQIIQRDRHAEYMTALALLAASIEKFALELRHLQRTEVLEVEEFFSPGQKGSSAMPHKRNPITAENLCGLSRIVRANAWAAIENVPLWHERDISHSSVERVIVPDSTILVDTMLARFADLVGRMFVYPERMRANLEKMGDLVYSESVMLALVGKGLSRDEAYRLVQRNAMDVWKEGGRLGERLKGDPGVTRHLSPKEIDACLDLKHHLRHVDAIVRRALA
ncbi:MAG: adenylosuccinate lyase [Nitrospirae bacterium]|nr:adenylosuccinate lyase [Nitrospirota bacterium]